MEPEKSEKYFDPKEYSTLTLKLETNTKSDKKTLDVLASLMSDPKSDDIKTELFDILKTDPSAVQVLIDAIKAPQLLKIQPILISLCWESGADFSKHLSYFVDLAINGDFQTSFEAITVIDSLEGNPTDTELAFAKQKVTIAASNVNKDKAALLLQLKDLLNTI